MSACPTCGNRDYLCQQCKIDELEDRLGLPEDHFDPNAGIVCWVQDLDEDWHASMYFEGTRHVTACGELFETPVADVRDDPPRLSETSTCDDCQAALQDDEDNATADGGFEKASEIATDGGLEEVFRRETIVATDDGMAIGEDAVPEDDREVRTDGDHVSSGTDQSSSPVSSERDSSPTDSSSTSENEVSPHEHPVRLPIGIISPSAFLVAANTDPQCSQAASKRAFRPPLISIRELVFLDSSTVTSSGTTDRRTLYPETKREGGGFR